MKKITAILLCLMFILLSFTGCGKDDDVDETKPAENAEQASTEAPEDEDTTEAPETTEAVDPDPDGPTNGTWFHFSYGLDDEGYMKDITALDYVDLSNLEELLVFKLSDVEPDDETMENEIKTFTSMFMEPSYEKVIEDGDQVNIDYTGRIDGVAFDGGSTNGAGTTVTIGVTSYIDDFLEQLIGHKPGETFDVEVTFPDPYENNTDLSGKDAVFEVTVNYVSVAPEFSDEFITAHREEIAQYMDGGENINTADDLRKFIYDWYYDYNLQSKVEEVFREQVEVSEIPEKALDITKSMQKIMFYTYYYMTVEDMVEMYGYDEDELMETLDIENTARVDLIYQAVAEQLGIHVTEEDFHEATGTEDNASYIESYGKGYIAQYVMKGRVADYLKDLAKVEDTLDDAAEDTEENAAEDTVEETEEETAEEADE